MVFKSLIIKLFLGFSLLISSYSFATTVPISSCGTFTLEGASECVLWGSTGGGEKIFQSNVTKFSSNGSTYASIDGYKLEKSDADKLSWDKSGNNTVININQDSELRGYNQIALGIKQGKNWSVFLVNLNSELNSFLFSANSISHIKAYYLVNSDVSEIPLPAAAWLFLTGLAGLTWLKKRKAKRELALQVT